MHEKIIAANAPWLRMDVKALWRSRELLWMFVARHFIVRYKQTVLGVLWCVLEPLAQIVILSIIFGRVLKVDSNGYPYPIYAFAGLIPWLLFSRVTMSVSTSLLDNIDVISKVYFPRFILPMAAVLKELLDSFISMALLLVVAAVMGFYPSARLLAAPLVMAGIGLAGFAVGLPLACILVPLRDVRQVLQIVLQVWMYATPIIYNPAIVPESLRFYFQLNPMYWAVEIFRWILLDQPLDLTLVPLLSCAGILVVLAAGLCVFLFCERVAIDVK